MLVRCPQCRTEFHLIGHHPDVRVVKYLCPGCENIVRVDRELDEVESSSSSEHYRAVERRKTVLVADDDKLILELAGRLLRDAGFHVLLAADGDEALRRVREEHPDLVVLDLMMPRLTGFDVLREMRHDPRTRCTPVMALSGVYKQNILDLLHQLGAQGFLDKEQLRETLVFRAQQLLASPSPPA